MDVEKFGEELKKLGKRVEKIKNNINTEEATKTSLVMPFFQILGYDIFDPTEFVPEFTADVGIKKGEKVDYAIMLNSQPVILIEAKAINEQLTKHDSQLFRYFGTTTSKFGILTNGEEYKFFTDLEEQNKMDITPFLIVNISNIKDSQIPEVAKFHKDNFDIENIVSTASELKYLNNLKIFLNDQMNTPSEEFTKYLVGEIYDGVKTKSTLDKFKPIIKKGLAQFINERVNEKLSAALNTSAAAKEEIIEPIQSEPEIITTAEEMETFTIVKIILKDTIQIDRLYYRDNKSYFNILLDDNIRKWIVRVFVYDNKIKMVLNDSNKTSYEISTPVDLMLHSNEIVNVVETLIR
ncbi:MAG: type I restriction endonuclease [Trichococcus sp.]